MSDDPLIDFEHIDFPSDTVTLRCLRLLGSSQRAFSFEEEGAGLDAMCFTERQLARLAFARGTGNKGVISRTLADVERLTDLDGDRKVLINQYVRYGIAPGAKAARLLISRLEASAANVARGRAAPGPS